MKWTRCVPDDIRWIEVQASQREELPAVMQYLDALEKWLWDWARTGWAEERPVAVLGVSPFTPGVFEAWALLSEQAQQHPVAIGREARRLLERAWKELPDVRRIQATRAVGCPVLERWFEFLGFTDEGVARALGSGGRDLVVASVVR